MNNVKCKRCRDKKAEIFIRSYNLRLCMDCFLLLFRRRVQDAIDKYRMFSLSDRLLIAVSGGKDSLALWDVLCDMGYNVTALHINLSIGGHSEASLDKIGKFAAKRNSSCTVINIVDIFGEKLEEITRIGKRAPCRICGMVKRYLMNREAEKFSCIVTGHHLDDEASLLLGNILSWREGFLARQRPVLDDKISLRRKVKPFAFVLEEEIRHYVQLKGIDYLEGVCPLSKGATSYFYKEIMNRIEEKMPAAKLMFYKDFLRKGSFMEDEESAKLAPCKVCGYLTVSDTCSFCRLKEKVRMTRGSAQDSV